MSSAGAVPATRRPARKSRCAFPAGRRRGCHASLLTRGPAERPFSLGVVLSTDFGGPAHTQPDPVGHTGRVEIEISEDSIRLGQLLKFANVVTDGGEAKALIAGGDVSVDGEPETRRGRQVRVGSLVEVDLPQGRQELRLARKA